MSEKYIDYGTMKYGEEYQISSQAQLSDVIPSLKREHYELSCWKDQDGNTYDQGEKITPTKHLQLSAQWRGELLDVNYHIGYEEPYDDRLRFVAQEAGSTIKLKNVAGTYKTSTDGVNWDKYELGTLCTLTNIGDKIYFSAISSNDTCYNGNDLNDTRFTMTGKIAAYGNIQYMLDASGKQLSVPEVCYGAFFGGIDSWCSSLTQAPELPATILAEDCYDFMFENCTAMTQAPKLPATMLAVQCYYCMFENCTALTQAPELPATILAENCYHGMFLGCTSLTSAPELPATTLANTCYIDMFLGCTSLTQAPKLPATTLAAMCYSQMFQGCNHLSVTTDPTKQGAYQILSVGSTTAFGWGLGMFSNTAGDFTGTPTTGTAYYCWGN